MRFLFFVVHPSKVKVFRKTINNLKAKGHEVDIAITTKDVLEDLVKAEGWSYTNIFPEGRKMKNVNPKISAAINAVRTVFRLRKIIRGKKYDLFVTDDLLVINGWLRGVPSILFQDDDVTAVPESQFLMRFASYVLSPSVANLGKYNPKKIGYLGYKELGGLHPNEFTPDEQVVRKFNPDLSPYFILRLVSLRAVHDVGKSGLNNQNVLKLIDLLKQKGEVVISAERELPEEFEQYRIKIEPQDIAHAISFATLMISDSQTMSAEAGVLGTPYIRYNDFVGRISYLEELENKYQLGYGIRTQEIDRLFSTTEELLNTENLEGEWNNRRRHMLSEKINLSAFMTWLFENAPGSLEQSNKNAELQQQFK